MKKILFVDSSESLLNLYYEEFSEEGYEVILALNGQEGLKRFEEESPDLTILDLNLPKMSGIEMIHGILGKNRRAQVIINTAHPHYLENLLTPGSEAAIIKSSDLTELKQKIREILREHGPVYN